jgi:hypothetical protein
MNTLLDLLLSSSDDSNPAVVNANKGKFQTYCPNMQPEKAFDKHKRLLFRDFRILKT